MKNVVIISDHGYVNGGQAKVAIDTALILRLEGVRVTFFCGVGPVDQRLLDADVDCVCLGQFDLITEPNRAKSALRGLWNRNAAVRLRDLLARFDPKNTITHVHAWPKSLSPSIGPVVTGSQIPHVYTLHEYFLACPTGGFYDHQQQTICRRRPLGVSCLTANCDPRSYSHKLWRVARQAVLWTKGTMPRSLRDLIYLSETQLGAVRKYLPAKARFHHLPNPVDIVASGRVLAERSDVFLFMGRLSAEKGGEIVAKAAGEAGVKIAFAGDGECKDRISKSNPDAQLLGWLNSDAIAEWMGRACCLVFPSLWYECLPLSVLEAMQRGLPVLVSDSCAATELVRHDVDGLHVATGAVEAWASAMRLMTDPARILRYSLSSFAASRSFLDRSSYGHRLLAIYQEVASAQRKDCGN